MLRRVLVALHFAFVAWLVVLGTAAAQQVPAPAVAGASTGRVSLVATGGISAASVDSGGAFGGVVTGSVTNRLSLEGAGTFTMMQS